MFLIFYFTTINTQQRFKPLLFYKHRIFYPLKYEIPGNKKPAQRAREVKRHARRALPLARLLQLLVARADILVRHV